MDKKSTRGGAIEDSGRLDRRVRGEVGGLDGTFSADVWPQGCRRGTFERRVKRCICRANLAET